MHTFIIELEDQPGTLAALAAALGGEGINIIGIAGSTWGGSGAVAIITNDDDGTRALLEGRGFSYRESELVAASLEDRPGSLADAARRLADHGVNIQALMLTGMQSGRVTVAFAVDIPAAAREALGDLATAGASAV
jgi:hypothetical protein